MAETPRETVLLVDDNEDSRAIVATILQHHGYRVLQAADGPEGVRLAREGRPDVVLMDVGLPRMDGWTAVARLREDPATAAVPVLMFTARGLEADRARARRLGCAGYLLKPVFPRQVVEEVRRVLGERAAPQRDAPPAEHPPST